MKISSILVLFFPFFTSIHAQLAPLGKPSDPSKAQLVVPLQTECALNAIYVGEFLAARSSLAPSYLQQLRDVLLFDLSQNGVTFVQPQSKAAEQELAGRERFLPLFWKGNKSDFAIRTTFDSYTLSTEVLTVKTGLTSTLPSFTLNGTLNTDRRIIHKIADHICKEITGIEGIASAKILYAVKHPKKGGKKGDFESEIWETDYDGHNQRQITAEKNYCISPHSFPIAGKFTRNRFFYVNYKQGPSKIYSALFSSSKGAPLISLRGNQLLPTISRQGHLMAFISDASGRADLFIQPLNIHHGPVGKPIQVYSFPYSVQASPTFSPDGNQIAFVSDKKGTPQIYLIDTPYPHRHRKPRLHCLTKKYRENTSPCWSPDGTKLAYSAKINGVRQIMVYDFMTNEEIQLTDGNYHKENPSFAPNSLHIVFHTVDSSSELFVINLKQRKAMQITKGPGNYHYPHWSPSEQK
ncbi:MAG: Tol-Pal system protein TolB [Chlamydiota bacterium]